MAKHTVLIVDVQKVPNLAAPQAGLEHTIIYFQLDGSNAKTYSVVQAPYPLSLAAIKAAINGYVNQRDTAIGQTFSTD